MVPQDALGLSATLRVRGAPWGEDEPQGTVPPVAEEAGSEARAAWGPCSPCWTFSPFCLLPPIAVTAPVAFQHVSPALG